MTLSPAGNKDLSCRYAEGCALYLTCSVEPLSLAGDVSAAIRVTTQLHTKFPVCFPCILCAKMNIFYFLNGLHHLLKPQLKPKNYSFFLPCLNSLYFSCVFKIKFLKFPVFSLSRKTDFCFPCYSGPPGNISFKIFLNPGHRNCYFCNFST